MASHDLFLNLKSIVKQATPFSFQQCRSDELFPKCKDSPPFKLVEAVESFLSVFGLDRSLLVEANAKTLLTAVID